jgi:hypothetical protein
MNYYSTRKGNVQIHPAISANQKSLTRWHQLMLILFYLEAKLVITAPVALTKNYVIYHPNVSITQFCPMEISNCIFKNKEVYYSATYWIIFENVCTPSSGSYWNVFFAIWRL